MLASQSGQCPQSLRAADPTVPRYRRPRPGARSTAGRWRARRGQRYVRPETCASRCMVTGRAGGSCEASRKRGQIARVSVAPDAVIASRNFGRQWRSQPGREVRRLGRRGSRALRACQSAGPEGVGYGAVIPGHLERRATLRRPGIHRDRGPRPRSARTTAGSGLGTVRRFGYARHERLRGCVGFPRGNAGRRPPVCRTSRRPGRRKRWAR